MNKITIVTKTHVDVRGKNQWFALLSNDYTIEGKEMWINIGEKTYNTLNELIKQEPAKPLTQGLNTGTHTTETKIK